MGIQVWEEWRVSKCGKTLLGLRDSNNRWINLCAISWQQLRDFAATRDLISLHKTFATKWYPPTGAQIEKDLVDLVFKRWWGCIKIVPLDFCIRYYNFAVWQTGMWNSTAEVEAFLASVSVFCKILESIATMCLASHFFEGCVLGCSGLNQLCWLQFWAVLSVIEDGFRIAVEIYCANCAYCCQMPHSFRALL